MYLDPRTCPASFLPWLASWFNFPLDPRWPEARVRSLLARMSELSRWRGTRYGMELLIEACTGLTARVTEEPSDPFVFRVSLAVPPGQRVDRRLLEDLLAIHKPAHAGYVLELTP